MSPRILIAGIGNIFLGDDAFGVEVVRRLIQRPMPEGVRAVDFGIRGYDLALALLDDQLELAILVDAVPRGETPGTLYVIEPDWNEAESSLQTTPTETHALDPVKVFRLVLTLGGRPKRVLLVGCEPTPVLDEEDTPMTLSEPVEAVLGDAVQLVESLVAQARQGRGVCAF
jgi:hydrogenase maturation protease